MTYTPPQPTNLNAAQSVHFKFQIKRSPEIEYFVQKATIPGLAIGYSYVPTPLIDIPNPGEHLEFSELDVVFRVDEDLAGYLTIQDWLRGLGAPDNYTQYANIEAKPLWSGEGIYSDLSLTITTAKQNAAFECVYEDAFPIGLSSLEFDATQPDLTYLKAAARFKYRVYHINPIV
ncbi:MAG: hypothetical protein P4L79_10995 [Legionella sp.]|uniref:hypothetical protein n=1 Tax=Legionella sp. TaxID=459 RepID=UPI00284D66AA|nr:hypothetical protein [Legionella sp.]